AIREFFEILKHQAYLDGTKLTKKKKSQCQKRLNKHLSEFDRLFETIIKLRESINGGWMVQQLTSLQSKFSLHLRHIR
nr:hypothetical protein [Pirellula sp.]